MRIDNIINKTINTKSGNKIFRKSPFLQKVRKTEEYMKKEIMKMDKLVREESEKFLKNPNIPEDKKEELKIALDKYFNS